MFKKCCFNRCYRRCCYNKRYCCNRDMENREKSEYDISIEELNSLMTQNATLVDIRSPQEYREGHLNNAINLPEYEIYRNASRFLPNKNSLIIVYCDTGSRSYNAFKRLRKMGYTNVYNLYKGMR
ncbi:MAG: rhodanese-like domain-containing protein [Clostridia bacterium]|nr:rhodanese-like domain-containing protein [Clostridia bacterium]